jgi:hypothetical protein
MAPATFLLRGFDTSEFWLDPSPLSFLVESSPRIDRDSNFRLEVVALRPDLYAAASYGLYKILAVASRTTICVAISADVVHATGSQ